MCVLLFWGVCIVEAPASSIQQAGGSDFVANSDLEVDADSDGWPDGWPRLKEGGSWQEEGGNHFLRLESPQPDAMIMLYREIPIPEGVDAIELSWRQRITGLKRGKHSWFDARIMMEFMNAARERVAPNPPAPNSSKNVPEWQTNSVTFLVPKGAGILKFMPCLFNVESGTFDLDDIVLKPTDPEPIRQKIAKKEAERQKKRKADTARRHARAAEALEKTGSLIPNGNFEMDVKKQDGWPDHWGRPKSGGSYENEDGNHFLRLASTSPGELVMEYQEYDLPANVGALVMTWRQRVTGLKKGGLPWFDARFIFGLKDAAGRKLKGAPSPSYSQHDTKGWVERKKAFLVPPEALSLIVMPTLFEVKAGTLDIDDVSLVPTDPAPLLVKQEAQRKIEAARNVPIEKPNPSKWPKMLKVEGNKLIDTDGKDVWLQGVNVVNLETLPNDKQIIKSTVVAIDEWKANCIRVPIKESFWFGKSYYQKDGGAGYRHTLDRIVNLAANRGAYVVIDLHRFRAPKQEHADFWKDCAAHFKNNPAVLFDIFNEPHDISWEVWRNGGFVGDKKGIDESAFLNDVEKKKNQGFESVGMQALVDAVRSTGARNIIIASGISWGNDLSGVINGYALDDKDGNGIMYAWHTYNWHPGWARILPVAKRYPIFLGEVGADVQKMGFIPAENQEDPYTFIPDMLGFIQKYKINWTGWCLHPAADPRMIVDWSYKPTPFWGAFAKRALAGEKFEMKRMR